MAKMKKASASEDSTRRTVPLSKRAVLFDLEHVAVNGRQIGYEVMKKALAEKGVKLNPFLFSRYGLTSSLKNGMGEMLESLGKGRLSEEKLAADIIEETKSVLLKDTPAPSPGFKKLVKRVVERGMSAGALSCLDRESAHQLVGALKLNVEVTGILPCACEDRSYPSPEAWLRLAKNMSMTPGACVVLASCSVSCKAALSSGMRCVVIPDKFTSYQDFGGADAVVDELDDGALDTIVELLESR